MPKAKGKVMQREDVVGVLQSYQLHAYMSKPEFEAMVTELGFPVAEATAVSAPETDGSTGDGDE